METYYCRTRNGKYDDIFKRLFYFTVFDSNIPIYTYELMFPWALPLNIYFRSSEY